MSSSAHKVGQTTPFCQRYIILPIPFEIGLKGSLLFCPDCGNLLSLPKDGESVVICEQCGREEPATCESSCLLVPEMT